MTTPLANRLTGWTDLGKRCGIRLVFERGINFLVPHRKAMGNPIQLTDVLRPGEIVSVPDQGEGAVEYDTRSHYVRLSADMDFAEPAMFIHDLVAANATVAS